MAKPVQNEDYYSILGVEKNASQANITASYRKLALKYHPDRNRGANQEEATEKFKAVSEAYACLGDVSKRRQYDLHGADPDSNKLASMEAVEVENVGWLGRFLAAQVAKLGVPIPTSVSPDVLGRAKALSPKAGGAGGGSPAGAGGAPPKVLHPGVVHEGRLSLAKAEFFTLKVDGAMAANGVVLAARSRRKNDRFRVLVFDAQGDVRYQAESSSAAEGGGSGGGGGGGGGRAVARCRLFLTPYDTLTVGAPFPSLDDTPPVCHSLDTLEERGPSALEEGTHLACVYCDNFLSSIDFTLAAVPMEAGSDQGASERVAALQGAAEALRSKKQSLNELAERVVARREALIKAQEEFKEAMAAAEAEVPVVSELLRRHAECQQASVAVSLAKLQPQQHQLPHPGIAASSSSSSSSSSFSAAAAAAAAPPHGHGGRGSGAGPSEAGAGGCGDSEGAKGIGGFLRRLSHRREAAPPPPPPPPPPGSSLANSSSPVGESSASSSVPPASSPSPAPPSDEAAASAAAASSTEEPMPDSASL